jgi:hypothetical protein
MTRYSNLLSMISGAIDIVQNNSIQVKILIYWDRFDSLNFFSTLRPKFRSQIMSPIYPTTEISVDM